MTKLEQILLPFEETGKLAAVTFDREYLRSELSKASKQTSFAFWLAIAAQIAVMCVIIWLSIVNAHSSKVLGFVFAAGGGGFAASGWAAVRLWRQKVATDLLLALVGSLDKASAVSVLNIALEALREGKPSSSRAHRANAKG